MDFVKKFANSENAETPSNGVATEAGGTNTETDQSGKGGGFMGTINNALGGGQKGEAKEGVWFSHIAIPLILTHYFLSLTLHHDTHITPIPSPFTWILDGLDKAVDWVQQHVMGEGPQDNESAVEQTKDEAISDTIRAQYKNMTGRDFPIADK